MVEFNGIINGYIGDYIIMNAPVIENVKKQVLCVSRKIVKNEYYKDVDEILNISSLLKKDIYSLNSFECFKMVLATILINKPEWIVIKDCLSSFDYDSLKEIKIIFRELKKKKISKFIIWLNDSEILLSICDYLVIGELCGKPVDVFKKMNSNLPFTIEFSKNVEFLKNKKIGYRNNVDDLLKDVYRYVK